jgi:hypothetical protein
MAPQMKVISVNLGRQVVPSSPALKEKTRPPTCRRDYARFRRGRTAVAKYTSRRQL